MLKEIRQIGGTYKVQADEELIQRVLAAKARSEGVGQQHLRRRGNGAR